MYEEGSALRNGASVDAKGTWRARVLVAHLVRYALKAHA